MSFEAVDLDLTSISVHVCVIKISPDGDFIAIGGTRNNVEVSHSREGKN